MPFFQFILDVGNSETTPLLIYETAQYQLSSLHSDTFLKFPDHSQITTFIHIPQTRHTENNLVGIPTHLNFLFGPVQPLVT